MEKRVAHSHLIARVLASDLVMTDDERAFLEDTMERLGLTDEERDQVLHFENSGDAEAVMRELPEEDRQALLDDLVQAALADGRLNPLETDLIKSIAKELGL